MRLRALKMFALGKGVVKPNEEFEVTENTAKQLIALKQAEYIDALGQLSELGVDLSEYVPILKFQSTQAALDACESAFEAFKNDVDAMKLRISEIESGPVETHEFQGQLSDADSATSTENQATDLQASGTDYTQFSNEELKALLAEKGIGFKQSAKKDELLALLPKD